MPAMIVGGLLWVNAVPNTWDLKLKPDLGLALACGLLLGAAVLDHRDAQPVPVLPVLRRRAAEPGGARTRRRGVR